MGTIKSFITFEELNQWRSELGASLALVPTMGAIHRGHLALVEEAKKHADNVIVSIFVNPLQFGPNEDFSKYPRTLSEDIAKLEAVGVDAVFLPNTALMYPENFQTKIINIEMSSILCGASRPGHFDGVLTVVNKLLMVVRPDFAVFGKKDYQQYRIIGQMCSDLNIHVGIIAVEIIRDEDGLALSSRNIYLSDDQRQVALRIPQAIRKVSSLYEQGERNVSVFLANARDILQSDAQLTVEYSEIRAQNRLAGLSAALTEPSVFLIAAKVGSTRLIDNVELG